MKSTVQGIAVLALGLFLEVAFLTSIVEPRRPTRVEVGELAFALPPDGQASATAAAPIVKRAHARTPVRIVVR